MARTQHNQTSHGYHLQKKSTYVGNISIHHPTVKLQSQKQHDQIHHSPKKSTTLSQMQAKPAHSLHLAATKKSLKHVWHSLDTKKQLHEFRSIEGIKKFDYEPVLDDAECTECESTDTTESDCDLQADSFESPDRKLAGTVNCDHFESISRHDSELLTDMYATSEATKVDIHPHNETGQTECDDHSASNPSCLHFPLVLGTRGKVLTQSQSGIKLKFLNQALCKEKKVRDFKPIEKQVDHIQKCSTEPETLAQKLYTPSVSCQSPLDSNIFFQVFPDHNTTSTQISRGQLDTPIVYTTNPISDFDPYNQMSSDSKNYRLTYLAHINDAPRSLSKPTSTTQLFQTPIETQTQDRNIKMRQINRGDVPNPFQIQKYTLSDKASNTLNVMSRPISQFDSISHTLQKNTISLQKAKLSKRLYPTKSSTLPIDTTQAPGTQLLNPFILHKMHQMRLHAPTYKYKNFQCKRNADHCKLLGIVITSAHDKDISEIYGNDIASAVEREHMLDMMKRMYEESLPQQSDALETDTQVLHKSLVDIDESVTRSQGLSNCSSKSFEIGQLSKSKDRPVLKTTVATVHNTYKTATTLPITLQQLQTKPFTAKATYNVRNIMTRYGSNVSVTIDGADRGRDKFQASKKLVKKIRANSESSKPLCCPAIKEIKTGLSEIAQSTPSMCMQSSTIKTVLEKDERVPCLHKPASSEPSDESSRLSVKSALSTSPHCLYDKPIHNPSTFIPCHHISHSSTEKLAAVHNRTPCKTSYTFNHKQSILLNMNLASSLENKETKPFCSESSYRPIQKQKPHFSKLHFKQFTPLGAVKAIQPKTEYNLPRLQMNSHCVHIDLAKKHDLGTQAFKKTSPIVHCGIISSACEPHLSPMNLKHETKRLESDASNGINNVDEANPSPVVHNNKTLKLPAWMHSAIEGFQYIDQCILKIQRFWKIRLYCRNFHLRILSVILIQRHVRFLRIRRKCVEMIKLKQANSILDKSLFRNRIHELDDALRVSKQNIGDRYYNSTPSTGTIQNPSKRMLFVNTREIFSHYRHLHTGKLNTMLYESVPSDRAIVWNLYVMLWDKIHTQYGVFKQEPTMKSGQQFIQGQKDSKVADVSRHESRMKTQTSEVIAEQTPFTTGVEQNKSMTGYKFQEWDEMTTQTRQSSFIEQKRELMAAAMKNTRRYTPEKVIELVFEWKAGMIPTQYRHWKRNPRHGTQSIRERRASLFA
ncbi:hypothetical protein QVD99_005802 [Batrachochytrium dendrobatidis]|nr:hypothetical protein QVD99_005802 [Batrachochytrium dendrobatidis]